MTSSSGFRGWRNALSIGLAVALLAGGMADARRGGSFGSRGSRTYSAPRYTPMAPGYTGPVQRSMTDPTGSPGAGGVNAPRQQPYNPYSQPYGGYPQRGGMFGGFGGGLMTGIFAGGLIGAMTGHGFGGWGGGGWGGGYSGGASFFGLLVQLAVLGAIAWFALGWFRRRRGGAAFANFDNGGFEGPWGVGGGAASPTYGGGPSSGGTTAGPIITPPPTAPLNADEIGLTQADRDAFEHLLEEVQSAFAREDYAGLRSHCTPEIVSYLSEELSENATHGRKNDVTNLRLLASDVSEAWREQDADYATVAMKYESIDLMRDRASGAVLSGDPDKPTTTTELWTFVRKPAVDWKLSAIQETA